MASRRPFTISDVSYDSNNDETDIDVKETIQLTGGGDVFTEASITPSARSMHLSGGKMYYGNVKWPTRYPDVAYTESGSYKVRLQNEYSAAGIQLHGPYRELNNVSRVACGWHLETALNVYVEISGNWKHYRRLTPSSQGLYIVRGEDYVSNYVFDGARFDSESNIVDKEVPPGSAMIDESQAVVASHVNRPMEVTSNGFSLKDDENVQALFSARLAEEEGIAAYDFYVGTNNGIYVANPNDEATDISTRIITRSFGVQDSDYGYPAVTQTPEAAVVLSTEGILRLLQGRQQQRLFPEGSVPWSTIYDIEYHINLNELAIATDEGLWFFDWNRKGIFRQYDSKENSSNNLVEFRPRSLVYDRPNNELLGWDEGQNEWRRYDGGAKELEPSVTTQQIETGGREGEIIWVKTDYDISGYDNTDKSTFAEIWHTLRNDKTLGYNQGTDTIVDTVSPDGSYSQGATSIDVTADASGEVNISAGDHITFSNHSEFYEADQDVTISNNGSGTINLKNGLLQSISSSDSVGMPYRGIFKLPKQERVRPPFRGKGHQIRVRNFDTLRDIQMRVEPRINYE